MANEQISQEVDYLYKSLNGQINVDEAQGIVEAFVAGLGNKDSVGDICLPGCFTSSLKRRKPRVVWGHDWNSPIGKVLEIYEVGPNDPRLPSKMRKAGIGGLYAKVQFNLKAEKGREAFANVSFFGMEQEWSIGYKTLDAVFDPVQTANLLKEVELYEVSPVLHGANQLTGTISIKADTAETETKEKGEKKPVLKDPKGGLTAAGRAHFKRTEGANLKPGVTGPADTPQKMRRKGSFLTRFFTNPSGPMKKPNGKPTRLALSAAAWGEPVPQNAEDAAKLAAKGRRLLERYENSKKNKKDDGDSIESKNHVAAIYAAMSAPQNETFGRASQLTRALATRFGGPVRLVTADNDIAIFEMGAGQSTEMMRVAYHFDGDEFMFGTAQQVKPETVYIPVNETTSGQTVGGVATGIVPTSDEVPHHGGHCCPGCGKGGNCDASVALTEGENPKIAFLKLKSLGDQLNFKVVPVQGGFVLENFGSLSEEAQNYVVEKIEDGLSEKFLNPVGTVARRGLGVPDIRGGIRGFNVDTNPFTARDADLDKLVLEGNPLINMGRGVPDPTPFGLRDTPGFGAPDIPSAPERIAPRMPAVPEPDEIPEPVKEPIRKPERQPIEPKRPNRQPVPAPPEREPIKEPTVPTPEREPVPVPRRPEPIRPTVPTRPAPVPVGRADDNNFAIAAMGSRRTPKQIAEALAEVDSFDRPSRQTRQRRLRDQGIDEMRRLMLLDGPEAGMSDPDSRPFVGRTDDESREREFYELMLDERRADDALATGDTSVLRPQILDDILEYLEQQNEDDPNYVPSSSEIAYEAIERAQEEVEQFINEDYYVGDSSRNPAYRGRNNRDLWDRRDEIFRKFGGGDADAGMSDAGTGRTYGERDQLIESPFTFSENERIYLDPINGRIYQADFYDRDTDDEAPLPDFNIDDTDSVGYDDMGNLVNRGPDGDQIIFSAEQLGSTGMTEVERELLEAERIGLERLARRQEAQQPRPRPETRDDDIVDGEIVDDGQAGMAGRRKTREENAELGRKIWLARTHDKLSLEEAGRRFRTSKQRTRQLELLHQKYLRDLGAQHPNRIGRAQLDDPATGLTDAETDLLRRRFDGETLDEAAQRLRTDKFAVRRMEQLALAKIRNRIVDGGSDADAGMAFRSGGRAVEADRPKARRAKGPVSRRRRNAVDPSFVQILDSLKDSGPDGLTQRERIRIAAMMRLRRFISNKIDRLLASGSRRRLSNLGPEIDELNKSMRGPFSSLAEAARLSTGRSQDLVSSAIKMANGQHDPFDLDGAVNVQVFEALNLADGDFAAVARSLGMDEEVVRIRANSHAMRLIASSRPATLKIHRRMEEMRDRLTSAEQTMLRLWINGASNLDVAEKMGDGMDEKAVIAARTAALRKIGVDVDSPELRSKIAEGRIFYDEYGLFVELTDDSGNKTYNRIADGPMAGMATAKRRVIDADFGDGRREYAVSRTVARDRANGGEESVMLIPVKGDDQATISTLIGRKLLGEDRGSNLEFPAILRKSGGEISGVSDASGNEIAYFGQRVIDGGEALMRDASAIKAEEAIERLTSLRRGDSAARTKMDQDVSGAEKRYANVARALEHLINTGDWIGGDLGVTGRVPESSTMTRYGLDADDDGSPIIPANATKEQFELRQAEWFASRNPGATLEEIEDFVSRAETARIEEIRRKVDLSDRELARLRHVRDSKEVRRSQNVVDLETLDDRIAKTLTDETLFLSSMSGSEFDSSGVAKGADGFFYVVHKGPDRLAGGVLDPRMSAGARGSVGTVAGQGDTRGANRIYVDRFLQSAENKKEMVRQSEDLEARIARGERVVTAHPSILRALKAYSPIMASALNDGGSMNLENYDPGRVAAIARTVSDFAKTQKNDLDRYEKIRESLVKFGGPGMDQMLSAEGDPIRALSSLNFYGRYADSDLPGDVATRSSEFSDGLTRRFNPIDPEMFDRWNESGSLRGGAFLAVGRQDSEIVRGGLLGPSYETQIIAPLKPLIGVSTPVMISGDPGPNDPRRLVPQLGPAIVARAIKMHKRDGFVDLETVLTDPDLAPVGFAPQGSDAEAGMAALEPRRPILDERGRLDPVTTRNEAYSDDREERNLPDGRLQRLLVPQSRSTFVEAPPGDLTPETRRAPWAVGYTDSASDVLPELGYPERMVHVVAPSSLPPDNARFPVGDEGELLMLDEEPIDFLVHVVNDVNGQTVREREASREALEDRGFELEGDGIGDFTPLDRHPTYLVVDVRDENEIRGPIETGVTRIIRVREILGLRMEARADETGPGGGPFWRAIDEEAVARGEPGRTTTEGIGFLQLLVDVDPSFDGDLLDDTRVVRIKPESVIGRIVSRAELEKSSGVTRQLYEGDGAYRATYRRPYGRFGSDGEAGMSLTPRAADMVARISKYMPDEDGNYVLPDSVLPRRDQDRMFEAARRVMAGEDFESQMGYVYPFLLQAESGLPMRATGGELPHDVDPIGSFAYDSFPGGNTGYGQLIPFVAPETTFHVYDDGTEEGVSYLPVRIGRSLADADAFEYHPASELRYARAVGTRQLRTWNHPSVSDSGSYRRPVAWDEEGVVFDALSEEISFQAARTKQLDEKLGFAGDSPQRIIFALRRVANAKADQLPDRFKYDAYGYVIPSEADSSMEEAVIALKRSDDFAALRKLVDKVGREGKALYVSAVVGYKPGSKTRPSIVKSVVYSPRLVDGAVDETTREFVPTADGSPHVVGFDASGSPIAHEVSDLLHDQISPKRVQSDLLIRQRIADRGRRMMFGDDAEAGMSSPLDRYVRTVPASGDSEDDSAEHEDVAIVDIPGTASARNGGDFDQSPAGIIAKIVAMVRRKDKRTGDKSGLVFSYPSSVKNKPGVKEMRDRTLFDPMVVYGEYDSVAGETMILATDERGITRLVPMSTVNLRALADAEERLGDPSANPDVRAGDYSVYVVGDEYVNGKRQRRVFNADRIQPAIAHGTRGAARTSETRAEEPTITAERVAEAASDEPTPIVARDTDNAYLLENLEPISETAFDGETTMPRTPSPNDTGTETIPTAWEVAKGLAADDPRAVRARQIDEDRLWNRIRNGVTKWLTPWTASDKRVVTDNDGQPIIDPRTGKPFLRTPYRKPWRPWGNQIGPDGAELPTGIKTELDKIRSWPEFVQWLNGKKLAFLDFETTGIPNGSLDTGRPLQIAFMIVENGDFANPKRLEIWIKPGDTPLEPWAIDNVKFNGMAVPDAIVAFPDSFVSPEEARRKVAEFIGSDAVILSHNMSNFDIRLWRELMGDHPIGGWIDTLAIANWLFMIDNERFRQIKQIKSATGNYDRDWNPLTNWFSNLVSIRKPGGRAWGSRGRKPGALERIGRRATGPLKFVPKLSKKNPNRPQWYPELLVSNSNEALARYFDIPQNKAHDAAEDIYVTARAFVEMLKLGERWGAAELMFRPDWVDWVQARTNDQYAADVEAWKRASGLIGHQQETLFGDGTDSGRSWIPGDAPGSGDGESWSDGSGTGRTPPGGGEPPRTGGRPSSSDEPNRRLLYQTPEGIRVYETGTGIHYEIKSVSPSDGNEEALLVAKTISEARVQGYAVEFGYGIDSDGSPASYRIASIEVLPKFGLTEAQARAAGIGGWEVHGIDLMDGRLKRFELSLINAGGNVSPKPSELTELPVNIYGAVYSDGSGGAPKTPYQYADASRRMGFGRRRSSEGPMAGMSGLTNRDGATNSASYWVATADDVAMADMADSELSNRLASDRTRFENLFHAGPASDSAASRVLDSIAAANRIMRMRSNDATDQNGFSVSMDRTGYKLSGRFSPPPGVMDGSYELPGDFALDRAELAKNASLSMMLDHATANGRIADAIDRVSRLSRIPKRELLGRLASHDYPLYSDAISYRKFRNSSELISDGTATPSSLGMIVDPNSELGVAARAVEAASRRLGINSLDQAYALRRGGANYSQSDLDDLINEFNQSVSDLFSFDHRGMYSDPEFRVKSDAVRDKLGAINEEIRRRYLSFGDFAVAPEAGMSSGSSPFGEADGLPILSGSKWFDARLHAIYGDADYEKVATNFGNRFRTLPQRSWDSPTDDDLVDIYHYATMLNHDLMVEDLVVRGERVDTTDFSAYDAVDNGLIGITSAIAAFTGLTAERVNDLVSRGRDVALVRRLAAMDPNARVEHVNAVRRRRAFARLVDQKKKELGEDFPLWLAEASIRNDSEDSRRGVFDNDFDELLNDARNGFHGESPTLALKNASRYMGMERTEPTDDGSAGMAGRRPFVRQRYDVKPVDGGFVIIDLDNRNAISSRVFSDKKEALRGAARMDRGDKTFDPFAKPVAPPPPRTVAESIVTNPRIQELSAPDVQPRLFNDDGDPNVGMSSTGLPNTLRFRSNATDETRVSEDNVRSAMAEYDSGRAAIPYPSPEDAPTSRLMSGYAASDSAINTVMGRMEQLSPEETSSDEPRQLVSNLQKLQKRRNYFYNQLRERLETGDPDLDTLETWHSQRAGLRRESTTRFGLGNLPAYVLPAWIQERVADSRDFPTFSSSSGDVMTLETVGNSALERISGYADADDYSSRMAMDEAIKSVQRDVERVSKLTGQSMVKFGQKSVRIGAQVLAMATKLRSPNAENLRKSLISVGLSRMLSGGGPRLGLAYLVNAVDVGLITPAEAKQMLRRERNVAPKASLEMSKADGLIARGQMSRLLSEIFENGTSSKSAATVSPNERLSMIIETVSSVLAE